MEYRVIIKDGKVTIMHNRYTFDSDAGVNGSASKHYDHILEIPDFADKWTCHTCNMFWDAVTEADYRDEVEMLKQSQEDEAAEREIDEEQYRAERQAEYDAENNVTGFDSRDSDRFRDYNGFGDY